MPMYDYKCSVCGRKREVMLKLSDLSSPVYCQRDGFAMSRMLSAPYVQNDYPAYTCPVTGERIEGRRAHEENLKRTGCRILEPGESDAYRRSLAHAEDDLDAKIDETADRLITSLPTEKRDRLAAEMEGGLDTQLERSAPKFN